MPCLDPVIGGILAGWRYDISGIAPDMSGDYEHHLATCEHCRARQRLHRRIDFGLIGLTSLSACARSRPPSRVSSKNFPCRTSCNPL